MARGSFKPEKGAKVTSGLAGIFAGSVNKIRTKGDISDTAKADAWAKTVNQRDWESPVAGTDNPMDDLD